MVVIDKMGKQNEGGRHVGRRLTNGGRRSGYTARTRMGAVILGLVVGIATFSVSGSGQAGAGEVRCSSTARTSACAVKAAEAATAKYESVPRFVAPGPAINARKARGKLVVVVAHDEFAEYLVTLYNGIVAAANAAHLRTQLINGNGVVSAMQQGILQAISEHAGAIILDGIDSALVTPQVQQAMRAGIPVVDAPLVPRPNLYATVYPNLSVMARLAGDDAVIATKGAVRAYIFTFDSPINPPQISAFKGALAKCAACTVVGMQDVEPTSWATQLPLMTANVIRRSPNVNVIYTLSDSMAPLVAAGIKEAGAVGRVSVITTDGEPFAADLVRAQPPLVAADPGGSVPMIGWQAVDEALRGMLHKAPGKEVLGVRNITRTSIRKISTLSWPSLYGAQYEAAFEQLWGLG